MQQIPIGIIEKSIKNDKSSSVVLESIIVQNVTMDKPVAFIIVNGIFRDIT